MIERSEHGDKMVAALRRDFSGTPHEHMIEQYIAEAEWQDGFGYWEMFPDEAALAQDFLEFMAALDDAPLPPPNAN